MKAYKTYLYSIISLLVVAVVFQACDKSILKEHVYSELAPGNYLNTKNGINSVLDAAYAQAAFSGYNGHDTRDISNWCTDVEWETGGGENRIAQQMINFTWDASTDWMFGVMWVKPYAAIRDANSVLDNLPDGQDMTDADKTEVEAEARFIRAISYYYMYMWFGPVPIRTSTNQELAISRPTDDRMKSFLDSEFTAVIPQLPAPGKEAAYGKANSGAAMAFLCKFYLNTKQWQKCADVARQIIDMGYYQLYSNYTDMFKIQNEGAANKSFIWVDQSIAQGNGNNYINGAWPAGFASWPKTGLTFQSNWRNWAAQYRLYDKFYNSFEPGDGRKYPIMTEYINGQGKTISLLNNDNTRSIKYWPDPNAIGNDHGDDIPVIRYADILLARAEALNELNGPNQESIDLINKVRERAGLIDLTLINYPTKEALRDHILDERGWEFYGEGDIRREDLIRMGKFITSAVARGHANAKAYMVVFPIPQQAMDSNPDLVQNEGY